ncbi:hypothetical protein A3Q56_00702 [Intoshia linei]|uniref:28S ribosomal protein S27, mitochondrial n=1 Tax=Intoshia linei TaxID=1819745 RepID=A0A177BDB8_9BILA|nr:hypothetical protein A3Q56_00702 [Intoshia linei]
MRHLNLLKSWKYLNCGFVQKCRNLNTKYLCEDNWKSFNDSVDHYNLDMLSEKVIAKLNKKHSINMAYISLISSKLKDSHHDMSMFFKDVLQKFRKVNASIFTPDYFDYSILRNVYETNNIDLLNEIIDNPKTYGVFLTKHFALILLQQYIDTKDFCNAFYVIKRLLFQDDLFLNKQISSMSMICAIEKSFNLQESENESVVLESKDELDDDDDIEESIAYYRIGYINNHYFDNFFDLDKDDSIIGKCLLELTDKKCKFLIDVNEKSQVYDNAYSSLRLLGLSLNEQFEQAISFLQEIENDATCIDVHSLNCFTKTITAFKSVETDPTLGKSKGELVYEDCLPFLLHDEKQSLLDKFEKIMNNLKKKNCIDEKNSNISNLLQYLYKNYECNLDNLIESHSDFIKSAESDRIIALHKSIEYEKMNQSKEKIILDLLNMRDKEEKLRYFKNVKDIDMLVANLPSWRVEYFDQDYAKLKDNKD